MPTSPPSLQTRAIFTDILSAGGWSSQADDNIQGETLPLNFVEGIIKGHLDSPDDAERLENLGLLALLIGVAEWGVSDQDELPPDPNGRQWESDTGPDSGKHLMSYGVGGIGISHADQGDLLRFVSHIASNDIVALPEKRRLLRLADRSIYARREGAGIYDQLRAAGHCAGREDTDLLGEKFDYFAIGHGAAYCKRYQNAALTSADWRVFASWMRAALRTEAGQSWLLTSWLTKYWLPTLKAVPEGEGRIEEALVNVRVRNSFPAVADEAPLRPARDVAGRVQRELDAYGDHRFKALKRRCGIMCRPVVLLRHFAGRPQLTLRCPPR